MTLVTRIAKAQAMNMETKANMTVSCAECRKEIPYLEAELAAKGLSAKQWCCHECATGSRPLTPAYRKAL